MLSTIRAMNFGRQMMQRTAMVSMRYNYQAPKPVFFQAQNTRMFSGYAAVTEMETQFTSETQKTYATFQTSDLSFKSLLESMENLQKTEMTYQEYNEFYPMADELVHYFEKMIDQEIQVNAN
jgi:hypothetical protein